MAEKHIYFVRHGESEYNTSPTMLHQDTPLTELGFSQAEVCAERCASIDFELIIASTYKRASDTAQAIHRKTGKPLIKDELFLEYKYPEAVIGLPKKGGPNHLEMIGGIETRYPGGELFPDMKKRADAALLLLESRPEQSIVVVSHAFFIWTILSSIVFGEKATFREFEKLVWGLHLSNTGITHATYNSDKSKEKAWRIITWNDDAHLGEVKEIKNRLT